MLKGFHSIEKHKKLFYRKRPKDKSWQHNENVIYRNIIPTFIPQYPDQEKSFLVTHSDFYPMGQSFFCRLCGKQCPHRPNNHMQSQQLPPICDGCMERLYFQSNSHGHFHIQQPLAFSQSSNMLIENPLAAADKCRKASKARGHLLLHQHTQKPFVCNECGKKFSRKDSLKNHSHFHTGKYPFVCDKCGKGFSVKDALVKHSRIHTGERPFICKECGKGFCVKSNLVYHSHKHAGTQPHVCKECGKGFMQKDSLVRHLRVHTGEQPFACNECGERFTMKSNLKAHTQRHKQEQKEQSFGCDVCGKRFTMKKNLKRHSVTKLGCNPVATLTKPI